jgi:hypothetical protein
MQTKEIKQLGRALAEELAAIAESSKCEWISEEKALETFPFTKDKLKELRTSAKLEYRFHWKHIEGRNGGQGRGRSSSIIYHRQRMIDYVEKL